MFSSILQEAAAGRAIIQPWTVKQYHWAIENGFLEESNAFELLEGFIVRKDRAAAGEGLMTVGDRHALVVQRMVRLAIEFDRLQCHLRIQQPIAISSTNEPEPDASVAVGTEDDYANGPPTAAKVSSVIEVADSSLKRDLGPKLRLYARAGIGQYIVIDLVNNLVLDHRQPQEDAYASVRPLGASEVIQLLAPGGQFVEVPAARLLP